MKIKRFENIDFDENDFDWEDEDPSEPIELSSIKGNNIGTRVRMKRDSRYYYQCLSDFKPIIWGSHLNGHPTDGTVTKNGIFSVTVKWDNEYEDGYPKKDLIVINENVNENINFDDFEWMEENHIENLEDGWYFFLVKFEDFENIMKKLDKEKHYRIYKILKNKGASIYLNVKIDKGKISYCGFNPMSKFGYEFYIDNVYEYMGELKDWL